MKRPSELFDLTGKVAVVTGGSRGIGRALVEGFAAAGADVVVASRKLDNCEEVATGIERDTGRRALPVEFNVSHWDQCDALVETVYGEFGRCDVLVNNAGLSPLYDEPPGGHRGALRQDARGERQGPVPPRDAHRHPDGGGRRRVDHQREHRGLVAPRRARPALRDGEGGRSTRSRSASPAPGTRRCGRTRCSRAPTRPTSRRRGRPARWTRCAPTNPMRRMGQPDDMVGVCLFLASDAART